MPYTREGGKIEGKLVFYSKVKLKFKQELYLQLQNHKNRNAIRDLRISTHKLNIETGRYKGINRDERLCEQCELNTAETEEHFLTECPTYDNECTSFLQYINSNTNISAKKLDINLIRKLMVTEDLSTLNKFGKFIRTCFDKRKQNKVKMNSRNDLLPPI